MARVVDGHRQLDVPEMTFSQPWEDSFVSKKWRNTACIHRKYCLWIWILDEVFQKQTWTCMQISMGGRVAAITANSSHYFWKIAMFLSISESLWTQATSELR
jgi:hypothetical protein